MRKNAKISALLLAGYAIGLFVGVLLATSARADTITTSGITAQTIIDRAKRTLNAGSDPFWADADFVQWIDEAVRETVNRTGATATAVSSIALVANTVSYSLGTSHLKVVAVEHDNGDNTDPRQVVALNRSHNADFGHSNATGRPLLYAVWNNLLYVWPTPRAAEAATNLRVYSVPKPTGVTATNSAIETPAYLDVALLYYVLSMAHQKNGSPELAGNFMALYEKRVGEYAAVIIQREPLK